MSHIIGDNMYLERKLIFLMLKESSLYTLGLINRTQEKIFKYPQRVLEKKDIYKVTNMNHLWALSQPMVILGPEYAWSC